MKALFIGGTGTISMAISKLLLEKGWELYLINRGNRNNDERLKGAHFITVDINDEKAAAEKLAGMQFDVACDFIGFVPSQLERDYRRVINTTSGIRNEPEQAGYSASKAALDKVTSDLAGKLDGTDVCINLADPGWCRTDLGGPNAPNDPDSVIPGIVVGAFVDDKKSGRWLGAQDFAGLSLEEAVAKAKGYPQLFD